MAQKKGTSIDNGNEVTEYKQTHVVLQSKFDDLLRHVDFIFLHGEHLLCGRQRSLLWMDIQLSIDKDQMCTVELSDFPAEYLDTEDSNPSDTHGLPLEKSSPVHNGSNSPPSEFILIPPVDIREEIPSQYMYGDTLQEYASEIWMEPLGLRWCLRFGLGIIGTIRLVLVWNSAECLTTIFQVTTDSTPTYYRLDAYYDVAGLRQQLHLCYWNKEHWLKCTRPEADKDQCGDKTLFGLDIHRMYAQMAVEKDLEVTYVDDDSMPMTKRMTAIRLGDIAA
ncbi:hypothetical protein DACRYDRAFT_23293 [Dacryopinax primogenitus]|uniref:Uncharacterized protein n=1 Tax=Dacryopinax primogenitus (strain DJM 731) TaxID=1858805 RepID=M5FXA5_DACPD|nr:uncharacterized protein DACRYDRAFT_23293 [Dacryopinax primogenitus]EJU00400.1 hypothetical protein DACRYDRAFT_23293 [Dacryopinax primogenitus]